MLYIKKKDKFQYALLLQQRVELENIEDRNYNIQVKATIINDDDDDDDLTYFKNFII